MADFKASVKNIGSFLKKSISRPSGMSGNAERVFSQLIRGGSIGGYELYKNVAPIGHAVDMIAEKVAQLQPVVIDRDGVVVEGFESLYSVLRKPNDVQRYAEFMTQLATDYLIYNNAYVHLSNNINHKSKRITPVCDQSVSITEHSGVRQYTVNQTGFYSILNGHYTQRFDADSGRILSEDKLGELIHIKGYLGQNDTKATSKLLALGQDAQIVEKSLLQVASYLDRGYSGSGIVQTSFKQKDVFSQFKTDFHNCHTGARNEGSMMVVNGTDVKMHLNHTKTNKDMQANENKEQSKMAIYQRYDIPEPLVSSGSQTYNNYQTALYALYENAVFPTFNAIFDGITDSFVQRNLLADGYRIVCDASKVSAMKLREAEEVKTLKLSGVLTVNELRSKLGYAKLDKDGDEVYRLMSEVPIGSDISFNNNSKKDWMDKIQALDGNYSDEYLNSIWNEYNQ